MDEAEYCNRMMVDKPCLPSDLKNNTGHSDQVFYQLARERDN
jgi:hypothetical protein